MKLSSDDFWALLIAAALVGGLCVIVFPGEPVEPDAQGSYHNGD